MMSRSVTSATTAASDSSAAPKTTATPKTIADAPNSASSPAATKDKPTQLCPFSCVLLTFVKKVKLFYS